MAPWKVRSRGPIGQRIREATIQATNLQTFRGEKFSKETVKLASRLGLILRALGVQIPEGSSAAKLGFAVVRERRAKVSALVGSGQLSREDALRLEPILLALAQVREIGYGPMEQRIQAAVDQAQNLQTLRGREFFKEELKLAQRLGLLLRDLHVQIPQNSTATKLGFAVIRERRAKVSALVGSGQLSEEDASRFDPILQALGQVREIKTSPRPNRSGSRSVDPFRVFYRFVSRAKLLKSRQGKSATSEVVGPLYQLMTIWGMETDKQDSAGQRKSVKKLIRNPAILEELVSAGRLDDEKAKVLRPLLEGLKEVPGLLEEDHGKPRVRAVPLFAPQGGSL